MYVCLSVDALHSSPIGGDNAPNSSSPTVNKPQR